MTTTQLALPFARRSMHRNSLEAYESEGVQLGKRAAAIHALVLRSGRTWTDRQLMTALGFTDMNSIRPRVSELIKAEMLAECGSVIDEQTGKRVRIVRARE
jgi:hypothetical protein